MKDKIKNVVIIVLSAVVVFFIVVPWLTGNDTGRSVRDWTPAPSTPLSMPAASATPAPTAEPTKEPTAQPTNTKAVPTSPAVSRSSVEPTATDEPVVAAATKNPKKSVVVYVTATGKKYHKAGCQYLKKSRIPIDLVDAKAEGYTPCSKCHPPQ